jgi:hypothetical protein
LLPDVVRTKILISGILFVIISSLVVAVVVLFVLDERRVVRVGLLRNLTEIVLVISIPISFLFVIRSDQLLGLDELLCIID